MAVVADMLRKALPQNLTVSGLAPMLGITRPSLSKVLNGRAELSIPLALRIEATFGISARKLLIAQLDEQIAQVKTRPILWRDGPQVSDRYRHLLEDDDEE
jgi:plasmid maintenance system antidote protein VapI